MNFSYHGRQAESHQNTGSQPESQATINIGDANEKEKKQEKDQEKTRKQQETITVCKSMAKAIIGHEGQVLPTRSVDADVVARFIRELLWEAPSKPPSIVTPNSLHFIKREGDMFETAVETLLGERKIGVR